MSTATDPGQEVFRHAKALYEQAPDWVTFFREVLGIGGIIRRTFAQDAAGLRAFEDSEEHDLIQHMLADLRERHGLATTPAEPQGVVTIRMPKSVHDSLRQEAKDRGTSMNQLCITKLLQTIPDGLVPASSAAQWALHNNQPLHKKSGGCTKSLQWHFCHEPPDSCRLGMRFALSRDALRPVWQSGR